VVDHPHRPQTHFLPPGDRDRAESAPWGGGFGLLLYWPRPSPLPPADKGGGWPDRSIDRQTDRQTERDRETDKRAEAIRWAGLEDEMCTD
jgi:hypothetical protein